jgi:hypothetical protein
MEAFGQDNVATMKDLDMMPWVQTETMKIRTTHQNDKCNLPLIAIVKVNSKLSHLFLQTKMPQH